MPEAAGEAMSSNRRRHLVQLHEALQQQTALGL